MRKIVLGLIAAILLGFAGQALAQPPPVPALPDTERRTTYSITAGTGPYNVGFQLYGDGTDYGNWIEVWVGSTKLTAGSDYTLSSVSGSLATLPRPITNATITFAVAQTGTVNIVGARRPRRLTQLNENQGVSARNFNQLYTDLVATERERWDYKIRSLIAPFGETLTPLPSAATRAGGLLCFDINGNPIACAAGIGSGNVVGPNVSVVGHIPVFANTTGTLLADGGLIGTGDVTGPASATNGAIVLFNGTSGKILQNGPAGTSTTVLHGNASGIPTYGAVVLTTDVSGILPVANGGTALASGTSGGILGYTASGVIASSVALTANQIIIGGGAGATPIPLGTLGTTTTVLKGNAAGAPSFGSVVLTTDVTGVLPFANGGTGISAATSGGIPYFNSTSSLASSALLTANALVLGGGAGAAPSTPVGLGTTTTVLHGNASGPPSYGAVTLTSDVAGILPVANGGTSLSSGTSGGVLGFTAAGTIASSVALTANQIVLGGGAGSTPTPLGSLGTTSTVLHGNAAGAPTFGPVALTTDVSGQLPLANGGTGQGSASAARGATGLNIDAVTTFGNASYVVLTTDRVVATSVSFTNPRTVTLPAVSTLNPGQMVVVVDSFGAINGANDLTIAANAADTINGAASFTITTQYSGAVLWPIGSNKWGYIASAGGGGGSGTVTSVATGSGLVGGAITTTGTLNIQNIVPGGRLTLTSGVPVLTSTVSAATTVYYAPYNHPFVPVYDGSVMTLKPITASSTDAVGLSVALGANWTLNSNWDWFVGVDSGTVRLCSGPAWTSDTARGTGAGTTELQLYNGLWTNKVSMTCRYANASTFTCGVNQCTYVGSMRTGSAGQTNHIYGAVGANCTAATFGLWNMYNRVDVKTFLGDSTDSWNYSTNTWRSANASNNCRVTYIAGMAEDAVSSTYAGISSHSAAGISAVGVGVDVTNAFSGSVAYNTTAGPLGVAAFYSGVPGLGLHFLQAIEISSGATSTFYGDVGVTYLQSGFHADLRM